MGKLTKASIAIALGLTLSLSMFTGVFAQSAKQSSATVSVTTTAGPSQTVGQIRGNQWGGNQWRGNQWHGNQWGGNQGRGACGWNARCVNYHRPVDCIHVGRWVRFGHAFRRVTSLSCRRW